MSTNTNTNTNTAPPKVQIGAFRRAGQVSGPGGGGVYFRDGRYLVILERITAGASKKGLGEYAAAEFTIAEVVTGFGESNKAGERPSVTFMFSKHGDVAVSNFRGLIGALIGFDPNATEPGAPGYATPEQWEAACYRALESDGRKLSGAVLDVTAATIGTKSGGKFTKTTFTPVDDATEARVLAAFKAARAASK